MLTKARSVLHRMTGDSEADHQVFDYQDDEPFRRTLSLRRQDWIDMGRPEIVTVTVEPGDLLNPD